MLFLSAGVWQHLILALKIEIMTDPLKKIIDHLTGVDTSGIEENIDTLEKCFNIKETEDIAMNRLGFELDKWKREKEIEHSIEITFEMRPPLGVIFWCGKFS